MGTGKSSAAITYMNEHKDQKFIYITPYLDEASRIKNGCPDLDFVEPSDKIRQYGFKKSVHTVALVEAGRNITTTHQAFRMYSQSTLDMIREKEYTLIIDENVDVLDKYEVHPGDLKMAMDAGYIEEHDGEFSVKNNEYDGEALRELFTLLKTRSLIRIGDANANSVFYWTLPPELLMSFKDVFILTYLFDGQSLHHYMHIYGIPYEYIGIERTADGGYRFGDFPGYVPEYTHRLKDMLHIVNNGNLNSVGDEYHALSMSWYERDGDGIDKLRKNVANYFNNIWRDVPADKRLWGAYNGTMSKIKGKGYTKAFLTFNAKATNEYRDKTCLAYIPNVFMNVSEKAFYESRGIEVDNDRYALSIMVQWIWRSAIRDGEEVYLYIPSRRMRTILMNWIEETSKGGSHQ